MARIPDHLIDQVRDAHDIVDVVQRFVPLKRAGAAWKGVCPFHDDNDPSLNVNQQRQIFKCFVCGQGGNVFGFLVEHLGMTFPEAVRMLAEERGIDIPRVGGQPEDPGRGDRLRKIRDALAFAQRFFAAQLGTPEGAEARAYLHGRGYADEAIERFGLGYAPASWDRLLTAASKKGMNAQLMEAAGLAQARSGSGHYDRFRGRVIFPVRDPQGRVVTFGARQLLGDDEGPKYLNGPETEVFNKSKLLFGLDLCREGIRKHGHALLMEGYTDVLMAHMHGFDCAVAGMGTALTEQQALLLRRHAERVVLVYDADRAGQAAAERALEIILPAGLEVRAVTLPEGRDVDEILLEDGEEAFAALIKNAQELLPFKLSVLRQRLDLDSPRGRAEAADALLELVALVKSPLEQSQMLSALAQAQSIGLDLAGSGGEALLRKLLMERLAASRKRAAARQTGPAAGGDAARAAAAKALLGGGRKRPRREGAPLLIRRQVRARGASTPGQDHVEVLLLRCALELPARLDQIFREIGPEEFADPERRRLFDLLYAAYERGEAMNYDTLSRRVVADAGLSRLLHDLVPDPDADLGDALDRFLGELERRRGGSGPLAQLLQAAGEPIAPDPEADGTVPQEVAEPALPPESTGPAAMDGPVESTWEVVDSSPLEPPSEEDLDLSEPPALPSSPHGDPDTAAGDEPLEPRS